MLNLIKKLYNDSRIRYYKISNFFSVAIAICFAFVVNKLYVFQSKSESFTDTIHEFIKFVLGRLVTMAVEVGGVPFCVEILHQPQMIAKLLLRLSIILSVNFLFLNLKKNDSLYHIKSLKSDIHLIRSQGFVLLFFGFDHF
mgnify:CR=1 FL=1